MPPTLFDLYAAAALQGILANRYGGIDDNHVEQACDIAKLMLKERAKRLPLDLDGTYDEDADE